MSTIAEQIPVGNNEDPLWNGRRLSVSTNKNKKYKVVLKIIDTEGNAPIRIPITRKCSTVSNESKPEEWPTVLTPVRFYRKLTIDPQPIHGKVKNKSLKLEDGWLYVFVNGYLWRELRVSQTCHGSYFYDVNLDKEQGEDIRFATGQGDTRILLPFKIEKKEMTIEVGFSTVQWSWARIESMGGITPKGKKRESWFPDENPVNSTGKTLRMQRLQEVRKPDLNFVDNQDLFNFKIDNGKQIRSFGLRDYINDAKDLAFNYQQTWRDMEEFLAEISNPENADKHPYAPWFDTAVLANQYFFAKQTKIDAENVSKSPGKPNADNDWVKAETQRDKWASQLSLSDIQTALGTNDRKTLREKIVKTKKALSEYLDNGAAYIAQFTAAIDDYCTLPNNETSLVDSSDPHSGLRYELGNQIFARLSDHEFILDVHLETERPSEKALFKKKISDPGFILLAQIGDGRHALSDRFFILNNSTIAAKNPLNVDDEAANPLVTEPKLAIIGRRAAQFISAFASDFATVAINKQYKNIQKSIATLVSKSGLGAGNLEKIPVSAEEYLSGKLTGKNAEKYEFLRVIAKNVDEKIRSSVAHKFDGDKPELKQGLSTELDVINRDGVVVGSTTAQNFHQGKGFSRKYMKTKGKNHNWYKQTLEVWVVEKSKGIHAVTKSAIDKGIWSKGILPVIGIFEAWNLNNYVQKAMQARPDEKNEAMVKLYSAAADFAAISSQIYKGHLDYKHRLTEKSIGTKLSKSAHHIKFIRITNGLGAASGAFSAYLSLQDMIQNIYEGDDAAIAHGMMTAGFVLVTTSEIIGAAVAFDLLAKGSAAALAAGPIGWIGLGIILVGVALLVWVFKEDTPMEQWLANGPFSIKAITPSQMSTRTINGIKHHVFYSDGVEYVYRKSDRLLKHVIRRSPRTNISIHANGSVWKIMQGKSLLVGKRNEVFHPEKVQSREQRFAGNNGRSEPNDKFEMWKTHPKTSYEYLYNLVYRPTASLKLLRIGTECDYYYNMELTVNVTNYIEGKTLIYISVEQKEFQKWERVLDGYTLVTGEGSGPRTVQVKRYMSTSKRVKARVWVDMFGDGNTVLPVSEPIMKTDDDKACSADGDPYFVKVEPLELEPEMQYIRTVSIDA